IAMKFMYSTDDAPGHCAEGSLETCVNGLPMMPLFVIFMITLPTLSTEPAPKMSGMAIGPAPPRPVERLAEARALTSFSYSRNARCPGSSGRGGAAAGLASHAIAKHSPSHTAPHLRMTPIPDRSLLFPVRPIRT